MTATLTGRMLGAAPAPRPAGVTGADVLTAVDRAGLVGRGGGGFPTARKLAAVAGGRRRPVVVANGAEGEPLSRKDATLLAAAPHLVLDGVVLAAQAVGARQAYLCVPDHGPALSTVGTAVAAHDLGGIRVDLVPTPDRYVASEETALVRLLSGGPALPTTRPPRPAERGVRGAPTLVLNVETLAGVALAIRHGPDAYRSVGDPTEPGTLLLTVAGAVPAPGVLEVPTGTPLGAALALAGAGPDDVGAVLTGGYGGAWLPAAAAIGSQAPLTHAGLRAAGGVLGPGILAVLPPGGCGLAETVRVARYLAGQSAGQCGPCVFGLPDIAAALAAAVAGGAAGSGAALAAVRRWSAAVAGRGACRHPDGAARLVTSALRVFAGDLSRHCAGRPCAGATAAPLLPAPSTVDRR